MTEHRNTLSPAHLARRHSAEKRFRVYGLFALGVAGLFLAFLLFDIVSRSIPAFTTQQVTASVYIDPAKVDADEPAKGDYGGLAKDAWRDLFPDIVDRADKKKLTGLLSSGAADALRSLVVADPGLIGKTVTVPLQVSDDAVLFYQNASRQLSDKEVIWLQTLSDRGLVTTGLNLAFFSNGDSREAELAGIRGALTGSLLTIAVTLLLSLPLGVAAAIYLEEFASRNHLTDLIEVNINNLAAVPSIVFGLLGLAVFLSFFDLPRSAPLVGGLVLALLVLPTIIIASRAALRSVPPSVKEAAFGVGASHQQAVFHHVLPLALPGILTGTILAVARALGETAPLLMIGMVAFIVDVPGGIFDAATVLPVQIFLWSDLPEQAFQSRTAAAIVVLLVVLFVLNALAIVLRRNFERRW